MATNRLVIPVLAAAVLVWLAGPAPADNPAPVKQGYVLAPKAFRAAADQVLPAMVTIETFGIVPTTRPAAARPPAPAPGARPGPGGRPAPGGRPPQPTGAITKPGEGPTTGLIISPDGYIITSTYNFLGNPAYITVTLSDGSYHVAKLLGKDETRKLCLIKINGVSNLPTVKWASVDQLVVGQWAISVGVGYSGDDPAISAGIISAKNRIFGRAVQTDANISPANYGGPLVNLDGRVIGICAPLSPARNDVDAGAEWYDSGIGFAVPLPGERWLEQLKAGKTVQPGKMGVEIGPPPPPAKEGVLVQRIAEASPAKKAGIQPGDVVLKINGQSVLDLIAMRTIMGRYDAGDEIALTLLRGGREIQATVKLEVGFDQPQSMIGPTTQPADPGKATPPGTPMPGLPRPPG